MHASSDNVWLSLSVKDENGREEKIIYDLPNDEKYLEYLAWLSDKLKDVPSKTLRIERN